MIQINGESYKLAVVRYGKVETYDVAIPTNVTLDFQDKGKKTVTFTDGATIKGDTLEEIVKSLREFYEEIDRMKEFLNSRDIHSLTDEKDFFDKWEQEIEQIKDYEPSDSGIDCKYLKSLTTRFRNGRASTEEEELKLRLKLRERGIDDTEVYEQMWPRYQAIGQFSKKRIDAIKEAMLKP